MSAALQPRPLHSCYGDLMVLDTAAGNWLSDPAVCRITAQEQSSIKRQKKKKKRNCGYTVGCYESVGLNTEQTKVFLHTITTTRQILGFIERHELPFFGNPIRDGGCDLVKSVIQVSWMRRRGRHKTSCSSNITKWMG